MKPPRFIFCEPITTPNLLASLTFPGALDANEVFKADFVGASIGDYNDVVIEDYTNATNWFQRVTTEPWLSGGLRRSATAYINPVLPKTATIDDYVLTRIEPVKLPGNRVYPVLAADVLRDVVPGQSEHARFQYNLFPATNVSEIWSCCLMYLGDDRATMAGSTGNRWNSLWEMKSYGPTLATATSANIVRCELIIHNNPAHGHEPEWHPVISKIIQQPGGGFTFPTIKADFQAVPIPWGKWIRQRTYLKLHATAGEFRCYYELWNEDGSFGPLVTICEYVGYQTSWDNYATFFNVCKGYGGQSPVRRKLAAMRVWYI